jgi:hypothetical protein
VNTLTLILAEKGILFEIEGIPIFPGQALNFECPSAHLSFKIDGLSWEYRDSFNLEKVYRMECLCGLHAAAMGVVTPDFHHDPTPKRDNGVNDVLCEVGISISISLRLFCVHFRRHCWACFRASASQSHVTKSCFGVTFLSVSLRKVGPLGGSFIIKE